MGACVERFQYAPLFSSIWVYEAYHFSLKQQKFRISTQSTRINDVEKQCKPIQWNLLAPKSSLDTVIQQSWQEEEERKKSVCVCEFFIGPLISHFLCTIKSKIKVLKHKMKCMEWTETLKKTQQAHTFLLSNPNIFNRLM